MERNPRLSTAFGDNSKAASFVRDLETIPFSVRVYDPTTPIHRVEAKKDTDAVSAGPSFAEIQLQFVDGIDKALDELIALVRSWSPDARTMAADFHFPEGEVVNYSFTGQEVASGLAEIDLVFDDRSALLVGAGQSDNDTFLSSGFIGREAEVARVVSSLQSGLSDDLPTFVVIFGEAGMGKTSLARVAAARVENSFDHTLWIDASTPDFNWHSEQARMLADLGLDPSELTEVSATDQSQFYQSAIADEKVLVVVDNAEMLELRELRQLLPLGPQGASLVVTRNPSSLDPNLMPGFPEPVFIEVGPLSRSDARSFLSRLSEASPDGDPMSDDVVDAVLEASEGSPRILSAFEQTFKEEPESTRSAEDLVAALKERLAAAERAGQLHPRSIFDFTARAISDLPTADDILGFGPLVDGLDRLLSNEETLLPLAIGVTAPWGSGKSSLMKQLDARLKNDAGRPLTRDNKLAPSENNTSGLDRSWYTVWFDAWKYERGERIWAGLAKSIYKQSQDQLPSGWQRLKFRVKLERARRGGYGFCMKLVAPLLVTVGAVAIAILAESPIAAGLSLIAGLSIAASAIGRYWGLVSEPFRRAIDAHVAHQDFDDQLGFTFKANQEITALAKVLTPRMERGSASRGLAIFVDDLDRCRTDQIVETLEAINQIFNADDERQFAFILGMDQQVVAASLDHAYGDVISRLEDRDPSRVKRFGERFLAKIVQLSVVIPEPERDAMKRLLTHITGNVPPSEGEFNTAEESAPDEAEVNQLYEQLVEATNPAEVYEMAQGLVEDFAAGQAESSEDGNLELGNAERALQEAIRRRRSETLSHDASDVVEAEFTALRIMRQNPRALKRFDNAFRLQLYVANATPGVSPELFTREHLKALARWMALVVDQPEVANALRSNTLRPVDLEKAAEDAEFAKTLPAELANPSVLAYFRTGPSETKISSLPFETFLEIV